jgi:hypothetical protein
LAIKSADDILFIVGRDCAVAGRLVNWSVAAVVCYDLMSTLDKLSGDLAAHSPKA